MPLAHGQAILAPEVEQICASFSAAQFASLCNAVAWSVSGPNAATVPSYTERVNVADGGIDAEWSVPDGAAWAATSALIGPGRNVFQYKQRNIFGQGRDITFNALRNDLRGALVDVLERTGRMPSRYVLFTPIDLTHITAPIRARRRGQARAAGAGDEPGAGQKQELINAIRQGLDPSEQVDVRIVGAAELSGFLNDKPHIRSAYFATNNFISWQGADQSEEARSAHFYGPRVNLVGRQTEQDELQAAMGSPDVRAIILAGPHGIGKSRLALEVTTDRRYLTVFALDPALAVPDLLALRSPGDEITVVVEDPSPEVARRLIQEVGARQDLRLLLAMPTPDNAPPVGFGETEALKIVQVAPLTDTEADGLLDASGAGFPWSVSSWVVRQAGGNPGVLLSAARARDRLAQGAATFIEQVACDFENRLRSIPQYGEQMNRVLRPLSLLSQIGIEGPMAEEARLVFELFGDGVTLNQMHDMLPHLRRAGFVRDRGRHIEIIPPLLANSLATSALRARFGELLELFTRLQHGGVRRLLERLQTVRCSEVSLFWNQLAGPHGMVRNLPSALANSTIAEALVTAVPERMEELITRDLNEMTIDQLRDLGDSSRRELVSLLTGLLFRARTSGTSLHALSRVAEAELGTSETSASRVLSEALHPLHMQMPLSLQGRLVLATEMVQPESALERRTVGLEAISKALSRHVSMPLHPSDGAEPLDTQPEMTWADVWNYQEALLGLLITLACSHDQSLAEAAGAKLPTALETCAVIARPEAAVAAYNQIADRVLAGEVIIGISRFVGAIRRSRREFANPDVTIPPELQARLTAADEQLVQLLARMEVASFQIRLRRWAGEYSFEDDEEIGHDGAPPANQIRLQELAQEAVEQPELLDDDTVIWLLRGTMSEAQKAHVFWRALGHADTHGRHLPMIERIGETPGGVEAFGWFFCGLAEAASEAAENRLQNLMDSGTVTGSALAYASRLAETNGQAPARLVRLIREARVDPDLVVRILRWGRWVEDLSPDEYLAICQAMIECGPEQSTSVIRLVSWWIFLGRSPNDGLAELAWHCLESAPQGSSEIAHDCDKVANSLCAGSPDRAFHLLEALLAQPWERHCWNPLDVPGGEHFWPSLITMDDRRALSVVIMSMRPNEWMISSMVAENLREHLDQEAHGETLRALVIDNEDIALAVCRFITPDKPGYWPIAFRVLERYGGSNAVRSALTASLWERSTLWGPLERRYEWARQQVEMALQDENTPTFARSWLQQAERWLRHSADNTRQVDEHYTLNDERGVGGEAQERRQWAMDVAAHTGNIEVVRRVMPPQGDNPE